ncbi:MAG: aldehyde dehydrogenase family protein [Planctomycetota bacterium]
MPTVSLIPDLADRCRTIARFRVLIADHADELVRLMGDEVHKPGFEALASDVLPLLAACRWHERHTAKILRDRTPPGKPIWLLGVRHRVARKPLGRVAIIATWNYPVQLVGIQIVQAFAAGNALLVKPSEHAPQTQNRLLDLAEKAGVALDRTEPTRDAGRKLVDEEAFDHLVFTGSTGVGRRIAESLAPRLIPSTLELSGNDTAVVLASADVKLAARCVWYALTLNHGQTCMAPRRVLVDPAVMDRFLDELRAVSKAAEPRRLIDDAATERCRAVARGALAAGGELIAGDPEAEKLAPIVIGSAPMESDLYKGSHFGPLLAVNCLASASASLKDIGSSGLDEPEAQARHTLAPTDPLTLSVFGSTADARAFTSSSPAGTVFINDAVIPTGHPGAPLSAHGDSGWGVSRGAEGLLAMTRPVAISRTPKRPRVPLDPPPTPVEKITPWLRRLYAWGASSPRDPANHSRHDRTQGT